MNHALEDLYRQSVFFPWSKQNEVSPLMVQDARGVYLTLKDGKKLLDLKSQAFCANLGYKHAGMIEAMVSAAREGEIAGPHTYSEQRLQLAQDLLRLSPSNDAIRHSKVFYTLGGAEANENAIKMARMYTGRHKIITRYRSYHGASLATINFSGDYRRIPVDNALSGVVRFPDPYPRGSGQEIDTVRLLEEIIEIEGPETIAAILLEGITGANGVFVPQLDYWRRIRNLCDRHGIVLIADEVLSGFYRAGTCFGVDHFSVVPDIITMSKGLTAGYAPLGAVTVRKEIARYFDNETLWCGLTQYGNPYACAVARAAIRFYHQENIATHVNHMANILKNGLRQLQEQHKIIAETRSIGLLAAIDLRKAANDDRPLVPYRAHGQEYRPAQQLQQFLMEAGVSALVRFGTIILAPPLVITESELGHGLQGIDRALSRLATSATR